MDGYGRIYKNKKGGKNIPEAYMGNGDYSDTFYNDVKIANFFFIVDDKADTDDEVVFTAETKIVFNLNLEYCLRQRSDRMDALAHKQVLEVLRPMSRRGKFNITGYETGLDNVFSGFDIKRIDKDDLQPLHSFAVIVDLNYYLTDCNCN